MKKLILGIIFMLSFLGCSNLTNEKPELAQKEYVLIADEKYPAITITFDKENKFYGNGGVNRYFGAYTVKDKKLDMQIGGCTRMMGPKEAMMREFEYFSSLKKVRNFEFVDNSLILVTDDGQKLVFEEKNN